MPYKCLIATKSRRKNSWPNCNAVLGSKVMQGVVEVNQGSNYSGMPYTKFGTNNPWPKHRPNALRHVPAFGHPGSLRGRSTLYLVLGFHNLTKILNIFSFHTEEEWIGVFTTAKDGCWPLFEIYTHDEPDRNISWSTRFFNLSVGIKNPKVFDVPTICKDVPLTTPLTGKYSGYSKNH